MQKSHLRSNSRKKKKTLEQACNSQLSKIHQNSENINHPIPNYHNNKWEKNISSHTVP